MPLEFLCRKLSWLEKPFWIQEVVMLSANAPLSKRGRGACDAKSRTCVPEPEGEQEVKEASDSKWAPSQLHGTDAL